MLASWLDPAALTVVQLFVIAMLVEALAENVLWFAKGEMTKEKIIPMVGALLVALATRLDLFYFAGIELAIPVLGYVLSGVLIARGANIIHDLVGLMGKGGDAPKG